MVFFSDLISWGKVLHSYPPWKKNDLRVTSSFTFGNCIRVPLFLVLSYFQLLENSSQSFCRHYWLKTGEHMLENVAFESSSYYKVMVCQLSSEHGFQYFETCFRCNLVYFQKWNMDNVLIWVESWLWRSSLLCQHQWVVKLFLTNWL